MVWSLLLVVYMFAVCGMAVFGLHSGWLLWRSVRARSRLAGAAVAPAPTPGAETPLVTVQLPIFNERYVAERVVRAAAALDWPRERLQIQILDDSTDDTAKLTAALAESLRAEGLDVEHLHRVDRRGYKAGALAAAMPKVKGEFIAVFDADFVPRPDWLRQTLGDAGPGPFADARVGFVQTRWAYLNRERSLLTAAQGMMHDVHFCVEQPMRDAAGLWFNFNGSGGLWRRACIDDAGGWQADTLTEDLDLSYRAALRGWRGVYREEVEAPSELPERVLAFKRQQARWARGSIQTARKLLGPIWSSPAGLGRKLSATIHLCSYGMHPLLVSFMVLWPVVAAGMATGTGAAPPGWAHFLAPTSLGFLLGFPLVQRRRGEPWRAILPAFLTTLVVGVGVSASNTLSVLRGLFQRDPGEFVRTPKSGRPGVAGRYRLGLDPTVALELALAAWLLAGAWRLLGLGAGWWAAPALVYAGCFLTMVGRQVWERAEDRRAAESAAETAAAVAEAGKLSS